MEIGKCILAVSVGFWDSFLVEVVSGGQSELVFSSIRFMEENECSQCLQYCRIQFLSIMCTLESECFLLGCFQWFSISTMENYSSCGRIHLHSPLMFSSAETQRQRGESKELLVHSPVKDGWALSKLYMCSKLDQSRSVIAELAIMIKLLPFPMLIFYSRIKWLNLH